MRILASSELLKGRLTNLGKVTTMTTATTQEKTKRTLSERGVDAAEIFLERRGLKVIAKNWTCDEGLIDLICEDDDDVTVFEIASSGKPTPSTNLKMLFQSRSERELKEWQQNF